MFLRSFLCTSPNLIQLDAKVVNKPQLAPVKPPPAPWMTTFVAGITITDKALAPPISIYSTKDEVILLVNLLPAEPIIPVATPATIETPTPSLSGLSSIAFVTTVDAPLPKVFAAIPTPI